MLAELRRTSSPSNRRATTAYEGREAVIDGIEHTVNIRHSPSGNTGLSTSTSNTSVVSGADSASNSPDSTSKSNSPLPSVTSFSSFQTFGVQGDARSGHVKVKSYGFSGGSRLREDEYIRKLQRSASGRELSASTSSRSLYPQNGAPARTTASRTLPPVPDISAGKANAYYAAQQTSAAEGPSQSQGTATPTSIDSQIPSMKSPHRTPHGDSPGPANGLELPPQLPPPATSPPSPPIAMNKTRQPKKRQSYLSDMTPAQMKRISAALEEIGGTLYRGNLHSRTRIAAKTPGMVSADEEEEIVDEVIAGAGALNSPQSDLVNAKDEPRHTRQAEPQSPSRLPPSPRLRNLSAQVTISSTRDPPPSKLTAQIKSEGEEDRPQPVLTPSRTLPVKHTPSLSASSSTANSLPGPIYVPGQPRPVGSAHRSESSMSSRSPTPLYSPLSPITANSGRMASIPFAPDRTSTSPPASLSGPPTIPARTVSLGRQKTTATSPQQPSSEFIAAAGPSRIKSTPETHAVPGGVGQRHDTTSADTSSHLPISSLPNDERMTITEADGLAAGSCSPKPHHDAFPDIRQVISRRSVAESRQQSASPSSLSQANFGLGIIMMASRAVSQEGTFGSSAEESHQPLQGVEGGSARTGRSDSPSSVSSGFAEPVSEEIMWNAVFDVGHPGQLEELDVFTSGREAETLRKLSGVTKEELTALQAKLVKKAKIERDELRAAIDDSPIIPV